MPQMTVQKAFKSSPHLRVGKKKKKSRAGANAARERGGKAGRRDASGISIEPHAMHRETRQEEGEREKWEKIVATNNRQALVPGARIFSVVPKIFH